MKRHTEEAEVARETPEREEPRRNGQTVENNRENRPAIQWQLLHADETDDR